MNGTVAVGGACASSYECAPGNYCDTKTTQTCQPLVGAGGACSDPGADFQCTYQRNGLAPALWCDPTNNGGSCTAQKANGALCSQDWECTSNICGPDPVSGDQVCLAGLTGLNAAQCAFLFTP